MSVFGLTVIPIPGTRKQARLRENVAAATLTLSAKKIAVLEPLAAIVQGQRF